MSIILWNELRLLRGEPYILYEFAQNVLSGNFGEAIGRFFR
jgi:hypothetical protein